MTTARISTANLTSKTGIMATCWNTFRRQASLLLVGLILLQSQVIAAVRPNILLLITDDQDVALEGIKYMPNLQRLLVKEGITFSNFFTHTPICCPSRASILSGIYNHNGGATGNGARRNCYGKEWQANKEHQTFAMFARQAGYKTAFAGKYLNSYGLVGEKNRIPPGWDWWLGQVGNAKYYDYEIVGSQDGGKTSTVTKHGRTYANDYFADVVARRTTRAIREFAATDQPFLIVASWPTPHGPFIPAPQYNGRFDGLQCPRPPNYNSSKTSNLQKHWMMRQLRPLSKDDAKHIDWVFSKRHEMLQSVDEHIKHFIAALQTSGQLENTYIIYTSDNGFHFGQHRLIAEKRQLYESDLRVPGIVRGPHVAKNKRVKKKAVLNIDIAPTIFEIVSGQEAPIECMDGMSFLPIIDERRKASSWRKDFLVSYRGDETFENRLFPEHATRDRMADAANNTFHCVRSMKSPGYAVGNTIYCRFDDDENFVEFYNLTADKWQLHNTANRLSKAVKNQLESRLKFLKRCKGSTCRKGAAPPSIGCPSNTPDGRPFKMTEVLKTCIKRIFNLRKCKCGQEACIRNAIKISCGHTLVTSAQKAQLSGLISTAITQRCTHWSQPRNPARLNRVKACLRRIFEDAKCTCKDKKCINKQKNICGDGLSSKRKARLDRKIMKQCNLE